MSCLQVDLPSRFLSNLSIINCRFISKQYYMSCVYSWCWSCVCIRISMFLKCGIACYCSTVKMLKDLSRIRMWRFQSDHQMCLMKHLSHRLRLSWEQCSLYYKITRSISVFAEGKRSKQCIYNVRRILHNHLFFSDLTFYIWKILRARFLPVNNLTKRGIRVALCR